MLPSLRRLAHPLILLALTAALGTSTGCRKKDAGTATVESNAAREQIAQPWEGRLVDLLQEDTHTWLYVDVSTLRDDARVLQLMRLLSEENREPLTIALLEADELLLGWGETDCNPTIALRSNFITPELRASIIHGSFQNDGEPHTESHGVHTFSRSPDGERAISTPASNLLITGPVDELRTTLDLLARAPATPSTQNSATLVFAITPADDWGELAEETITEPAFAEQVRAITMISGALQLDDSLDLSARIALNSDGDPELAAELFGLGLSRVLPQLLMRFFSADYALHLTSLLRVTARDQGVLLHATLPQQELDIWLRVLQELAAESENNDPNIPAEPTP